VGGKIGAVAQLGERRPCKAEVVGSIPISSTIPPRDGEPVGPWDARSETCPAGRERGSYIFRSNPDAIPGL
jgi:hypothetical protein